MLDLVIFCFIKIGIEIRIVYLFDNNNKYASTMLQELDLRIINNAFMSGVDNVSKRLILTNIYH